MRLPPVLFTTYIPYFKRGSHNTKYTHIILEPLTVIPCTRLGIGPAEWKGLVVKAVVNQPACKKTSEYNQFLLVIYLV